MIPGVPVGYGTLPDNGEHIRENNCMSIGEKYYFQKLAARLAPLRGFTLQGSYSRKDRRHPKPA